MAKADDILAKYGITQVKGSEGSKSSPTSNTNSQKTTGTGSTKADGILSKYGITQVKRSTFDSAQKWTEATNTLLSDAQKYFSSWHNKDDEGYNRFQSQIYSYLSQADDWKEQYTGDKEAISYIDSVVSALTNAGDSARGFLDYYSQWDTQKDYDDYLAYQKDYDEKKNFDIEAGQKEIAALEAELQGLRKKETEPGAYLNGRPYAASAQVTPYAGSYGTSNTMVNGRPYAAGQQAINEVTPTDNRARELETLIAQKKQYLNQAKHIQEGITLSSVSSNADFKDNSGYVSTFDDGGWSKMTSKFGMGYDDLTYEYINGEDTGVRQEIINKAVAYDYDTERFMVYDHMTDDQIAIYNYHYAKDGKDAAEKYLDSIRETLNDQVATERFSKMEGNTALELLFGIEAGADQFKSGLKNAFNTEDDYIAQSAYQMASAMVREDLSDAGRKLPGWLGGASLGQVGYDAITTTANMAPSILTSTVANFIVPGSGSVIGSAMMGTSAAGNAYQEALNNGYDKRQARVYSTLIGTSEAVLGELLGGISSLGGKLSGKAITKALDGVDNGFLRFIGKLGGSVVSEGFEEGLQEVLTPLLSNAIMHTDENINWSEVAYSALLGAMTAGFLEGPVTAVKEVSTFVKGKNLQSAGITAQQLAEIGNKFSMDTVAYQLAGRVNENTGAYTMGRLFNEIGATMTEQNISDITNALVAAGIPENIAKNKAKLMAKIVEGATLTEKGIRAIEEDTLMSKAVRTTIIDPNATWFQRTKGYNDVLMALAQEKVAGAKQSAPGQENAAASDNVDAKSENGAEGSYEVSAEGKTVLNSTGEIVNVQEVADTSNGQMILRLDNGSTVNAEDVSFSSAGEALVYETVAQMGASVKAANILVNQFKATEGMDAESFAHGISEAFRYGKIGVELSKIPQDSFARKLNAGQLEFAHRQGKRAAVKQVAKEQATVRKNRTVAENATSGENNRSYKATLAEGIEEKSLTESQKASYRLADQIAAAAKVNIRVYDGKTGEHGYYDYETDEIYLNLNATNKSRKSMMAFTLGHELVHRAKAGSPAKYKQFANFLVEQYGKQGSDIEAMIGEQLAAAKRFHIEMSYEEAFEEVVCDACQRMLLDTDAGQKLAEFGAQSKQNKSFLDDLKRWIMEFMEKLRSIFAGVEPDSLAAQEFAKFDESVKKILADMYVDMTIDAGEHLSTIQNAFGKGTVVETNAQGEFTMANSQDGSKKVFNLVTWENGGRETMEATLLREGYTAEEVKAALTIMDGKHQLVKDLEKQFPEQNRINQATITTDLKDGHSVLSALVSNGDYPVNIDLLMVCKKRKAYQRVINRLCETGMIQQATVDALAIAEINKILGKHGFETACLGCFVESRRLRIQEWAQTICKEWNAEVKKRNPNAKAFGFGKGEAKLTPDEVMKLIGELESGGEKNEKGNLNLGQGSAVKRMGVLLDKVPSLRKTLSIEDLITPDGLSSLRRFDSNLFSMVKSRYGSNSPKFVQEFNPYNHEIAKYGKVPSEYKNLREYLYAIGGARMQSFSDFIVENWFDYCQIVADLAARKLPMHTYTKEIALAKLLGMTGIKINMSLIPDIDRSLGKDFAGLTRNEKGELELIWADKDRFKKTGGKSYMQSINFADAMALQEDPRYSANVGTIAIGVSDKQIIMMLDDARIRMVIPYHSSGMNPIFADLMGTSFYKDYTMVQNTTVKQVYNSKGQKVSIELDKTKTGKLTSGFQFNEVLQELGDARAAAQAYKDWCADASKHTITIKGETYTAELTPKFDDFSWHENYYKLLEDFNTYDCISEQAAPQGDVQQIYPEDFNKILEAELKAQEGHRQKQAANQAFDKAMAEIEDYLKNHTKADTVFYAEQHGVKLSAKDKKLGAEDKKKLAELRKGVKHSLPKSNNPYSYEALVSKPDMVVTTVGGSVPKNRADVAHMAKQNAAMVGKFNPKDGSVSVHVEDIDTDVILSTKGLRHGLRRTQDPLNVPNYIVTVKAGEILRNSIRINEITPSDDNAKSSYVLMGAAKDANGTYIVRFVVNHFDNNITAMDVLYAINAKKEPAATKSPRLTAEPLSVTSSTISIAELLDLVNQYFPDILPEEALKHYGYDARPEGDLGEDALYKLPVGEDTSPRALLANALEGVAKEGDERNLLRNYQTNLRLLEAEEAKLAEVKKKANDIRFTKGRTAEDTKEMQKLDAEAKQIAVRIDSYDRKLLKIEAMQPVKDLLSREKEKAYQRARKKGREAMADYRKRTMESRNKTAMRHKIQNVVGELNRTLLHGTKDRHVPEGLQKAVAGILDSLNMEVRNEQQRRENFEATLARYDRKIAMESDPEKVRELIEKRRAYEEKGDQFKAKMEALKLAYDEIQDSDDPLLSNAYDDGLSAHMMTLIVEVGDTPLGEMSLKQLECVYDVCQIVQTTIRNANKAFKAAKNASIAELGGRVMREVAGKAKGKKYDLAAMEAIRKFGWNNLKPVYAFETIGSDTFTEIFNNVRKGEDVWAMDVTEARTFYLEKAKKYGYDSWDFDKRYAFESTSGMAFSLSLEQIMSLYAYSKREQAADHLHRGGIVFDESTEVTMQTKLGFSAKFNPTEATAYNVSLETLTDIVSKLTEEQKGYVDEMQEYLSTVMGNKGNEVSLEMYGIKLFKEKFYFPLKSASQFMAKAKEQQQGDVKIKNSGFSRETTKKASNPIVLTPFMNVWADHVNEMSMYHAFVLPMEDFYRVYNYRTATSDTAATESVEMYLQNAFGKGATKYIDQLLKDLNGGARTDSTTGVINKLTGLFKKGAVFASLSVVVQQPSAIARAAALVDTKYFIGPKVDHKRHKELWDEVKQYAPVAIIKEMGYFDTNMGKSTQDFILGKEYSGIKEKMKAMVTDGDYRDEVLSKAPALADEIAWCGIWEAVKREMHDKHPGLDVKSEPFLMLAGARFTEVITKTQVYDSVLSRSANMRSKDTGMKMATAFMAEPTTSINMIADALLQGKRGGKEGRRYCRKTVGAVIASVILNSFLVAWVQAARDDDEDESYMEKYVGSFTAEMLDGMNPLTYIPFIKDIVSIVQGYDVERSDMSVISDVVNAIRKLASNKVSGWKKVEDFAGSVCQIFGLPVKNIMRDVRGAWQAFNTIANGEKTTARGIGYAVKGAITGKNVSNPNQLYEARLAQDAAHTARVEARYAKDAEDAEEAAKSANAAVRDAIKSDFLNSKISSETAMEHMVTYVGMTSDEAYWLMGKWKYRKVNGTEDGYRKFSAFFTAVQTGKNLKNVIKDYVDHGVEAKTLRSQITEEFKPLYVEMSAVERAAIKGYLLNAFEQCGMVRLDAEKKLADWDFEAKHGFDYENRGEAYRNREITREQLMDSMQTYGGMTKEEAERYIGEQDFHVATGYAYDDKAKAYKEGYLDADILHMALMNIDGLSEEEADVKMRAYNWMKQNPSYELDVNEALAYTKTIELLGYSIEESGIDPNTFVQYRNMRSTCKGTDADGDGQADSGTIKSEVMEVIDSLPISIEQKDALYFLNGWAKSRLREAPWH